jgi:drug/metabolite transporter (DMT)-like permease
MLKIIKNHLLILITLFIIVLGQIVGKFASFNLSINSFSFVQFLQPLILLGYILMIIQGILWIFVLRNHDLSYAYPLLSFGYVFVFFFSILIFNETFSYMRLLSIMIIIIGVSFMTYDKTKRNLPS